MAGNCEWASEVLSTVQIFAHSGGTAWSFGCATRRFRQFYRDNTETRLIMSGFPKGNQTSAGHGSLFRPPPQALTTTLRLHSPVVRDFSERVKFPVLAAWVDPERQSLQQPQVVLMTGKGLREFRRVHARNLCFHARCDHVPAQLVRGNLPDRKQRFEPGPLQLLHPVIANIQKKQVSECNRGDCFGRSPLAYGAHPLFVFLVRARPGRFHGPERDPGSLGPRFYQRPPDRMHRHAVRRGVKGREQRGYLETRLLPEKVQCPCAVFAAAPR